MFETLGNCIIVPSAEQTLNPDRMYSRRLTVSLDFLGSGGHLSSGEPSWVIIQIMENCTKSLDLTTGGGGLIMVISDPEVMKT